MSEEEATRVAAAKSFLVRLTGEDGTCTGRTDNLRDNRVKIAVEDGVVVAATIF